MQELRQATKACDACGTCAKGDRVSPMRRTEKADYTVALAGNPNTGKSTVFNAFTGMRQHVGNLPKVRVAVGDRVLKGQLLAEAEGTISAAVHAPTSGVIASIGEALIPHPSGLPDICITLETDGVDTWQPHTPPDWRHVDRQQLTESLRSSGIVGLGGAAFAGDEDAAIVCIVLEAGLRGEAEPAS